jgi:cytochrome d ubiquinol oxidase subunit II
VLDLPTIWFLLIGVLIAGYAVLDGFDLGAGVLHLFVARDDGERRSVIAAIGPVWDGNEVWLLTAGGALFAAFPVVYATVFSGFYLAVMLLLVALIFRAVAIEFRNHEVRPAWRSAWDVAFAAGSTLAALLLGVALANILVGLPLDADGLYRGGLLGLLRPFPLVVGILSVALFAWHGAGWLTMRTAGPVRERTRRAGRVAVAVVLVAWIAATLIAVVSADARWSPASQPLAWVAAVTFVVAVAAWWWWNGHGRHALAMVASGIAIVANIALVGIGLYPALVPSTGAGEDITVAVAASSELTLSVMLIIALVGMPLVLLYTTYVYRHVPTLTASSEGYGH